MATDGWLTAHNVEDVHHALRLGADINRIATVISRARQITLPALLEYVCLRQTFLELPSLPLEIQNSVLGRSLRLIGSPLVLSDSRVGDMRPRPCEFMTFEQADDVTSEAVEFFKMRFWESALNVGFARDVAGFLATGLHEMMTNAVQHSKSKIRMIAGYAVFPKFAQFTVVDVGQGVLAALRAVEKYQHVNQHFDAIQLALHNGVTSDPSGKGGFGFRDIFRALTEQWGYLRCRSGEACFLADGTGLSADTGEHRPVPPMAGFQVSVTCRASPVAPAHPTV